MQCQDKWALRTLASSVAMIFSSPGCSMNEFMESASPCSPVESTMEGLPARSVFPTSRGVRGIRLESHLIRICGTWFAISIGGYDVVTVGILLTCEEIYSSRRCHSL